MRCSAAFAGRKSITIAHLFKRAVTDSAAGRLVVILLFLLACPPTGYSGTAGNGASQRNGGTSHMPIPAPAANPNPASAGPVVQPSNLDVHIEPVTAAPEDQSPQRVVISPDGHHIAFISIRGSRFAVVIDSKSSPKYDEIGAINNAVNKEIIFSADGQHAMFIARRGDDQMAVVDGHELVGYAMVDQFSFSPDGKQYAFVGRHDLQNGTPVMVVLNGKEGPGYFAIVGLQFSSNNAHVAYVSTVKDPSKPENTSLVIDGKNEKLFYQVHDFHFSDDGNHWAYVGQDFTGNAKPGTSVQGAHLMVDGKELAAFESIYSYQLSADGHVGYTANKRTHMSAQSEMVGDECAGLDAQVWDVAKGHRFPAHGASPLYLSPDGQHVAWLEERPGNNELSLAVNGKHGLGYRGIHDIFFSPDSQHINYVAIQGSNGNYVVRDEDEAGPYQGPITIFLSPSGKHVAFEVKGQQTAFVVEDGKQQTTYEAIYGPLVFSPDGEHLAYIAQAKDPTANMTPIERQQAEQSPAHNRGLYIVLDGQQQQVPLAIKFHAAVNTSGIYFSPDSKHLAYTDYHTVVVDGRQVKSVPKFTPNGPKVKLPPDTIDGAAFGFTPDNKHLLYTIVLGWGHCVIDGDEVAGYQMAGSTVGHVLAANHRPTIQPDGSVFFFAIQDAAPGAPGPSPTLYRVTVNPGPARDFGTAAADASASAATPANQPQANATPPAATPPATPPPPPQQNKPPPQNTPASATDRAREQAQKAKDAANKLRGIFGR
jgi:hypothetical protein